MSIVEVELKPRRVVPEDVVESSNLEAVKLLKSWLDEDDGYDACVWPVLESELAKDRFCLRDNHEPGA